MWRERTLKTVLLMVGLFFVSGLYPLIGSLRNPAGSDTGDTMMLSLYVTLGVFLLIAVRHPAAHRSLIAFTAWSSVAHAAVMTVQAYQIPSERVHLLSGSAALVIIAVALIALAPARPSGELASATVNATPL